MSEIREIVDSIPLTQDSEQATDVSAEEIGHGKATLNYPEMFKSVLNTTLVAQNEVFVNLYFQW